MNKKDCLEAVNQRFEDRRAEDRLEQSRRRGEIEKKLPEITALEREQQANYAAFFRFFADNDGDEKAFQAFREKSLLLQEQIVQRLTAAGYPADYLDPVYHCRKCCDEGAVEGVLCDCYKQALSEEYLRQSGLKEFCEECSFSAFDLTLYSEESDGNRSPRDTMKTLLAFSEHYAETFGKDSSNLLFIGEPGCGKTFLSVCIGGEVIRKGNFVLYAPVQKLLADFEAETFRAREKKFPTEDYLSADLLIIDDLGTEFYSSFVEATLYNVINTRIARSLPTIISTNLTIADRAQTYADRLNSRLTYSFLNLGFPDADLRKEKMRRRRNQKS